MNKKRIFQAIAFAVCLIIAHFAQKVILNFLFNKPYKKFLAYLDKKYPEPEEVATEEQREEGEEQHDDIHDSEDELKEC